ncbi:hypothetical protein TorRG33x02_311740 [Trema orientale]|uniref:Uncharacterized protein n=1 Tax=Trema orientale TaxID=63057 RepID=A0A2P5BR22_TREOI|nr:hypothetical protein TorRG33x02_311740 [Trema orientale]
MPGARRCRSTPRRRVLGSTIGGTTSPRAYRQPGLGPPPQSASVRTPSRSADRLSPFHIRPGRIAGPHPFPQHILPTCYPVFARASKVASRRHPTTSLAGAQVWHVLATVVARITCGRPGMARASHCAGTGRPPCQHETRTSFSHGTRNSRHTCPDLAAKQPLTSADLARDSLGTGHTTLDVECRVDFSNTLKNFPSLYT